MPRTWKMRKVVGHESEPFPSKNDAGWLRLFFKMECGHRRRYGSESPEGSFAGDSDYGPGSHSVGDRARCYECAKTGSQTEQREGIMAELLRHLKEAARLRGLMLGEDEMMVREWRKAISKAEVSL